MRQRVKKRVRKINDDAQESLSSRHELGFLNGRGVLCSVLSLIAMMFLAFDVNILQQYNHVNYSINAIR